MATRAIGTVNKKAVPIVRKADRLSLSRCFVYRELARTVDRSFASSTEWMHALLGLAKLACIAPMHSKTMRQVDLRSTNIDKFAQFRI